MIRRLMALTASLIVGAFDLLVAAARRALALPPQASGVVLYYHAVKPHQRERFARQMDDLLKRARPAAADAPEIVADGTRQVCVTFDDGYRSVVEYAVPELAQRQIPFTVFAPSGSLGDRPSWVRSRSHAFWEECVLSAPELRKLAAMPLATIASHTVTHRNLPALAPAEAAEELARSRQELEAATGSTVDLLSFPHGAWSPALATQARNSGYRRVFSIEPARLPSGPVPFVVGRVAADPDDWPLEFRLKLAGAYRWRATFHRLFRRDP